MQHLPIHSALLARGAAWHATVPCLETVYTGIGAVFFVKMIIIFFFLHENSRLLKENSARLHKGWTMGMLQLGCVQQILCATIAEDNVKTRVKTDLGGASEPQQSPVHPEIRPSKPSETFTLHFVLPGRAQPLF